jgi:putative tricarboxylic transport membrane protein
MEVAFRQSLMISHGDFGIFTGRPISLAFLLVTALFLVIPIVQVSLKQLRKGGPPGGSANAT